MVNMKQLAERLTRRESEIMNAVFALGNRATAEEIRGRLADPPGDSSVRVMLTRLEKGLSQASAGRPALSVFGDGVANGGEAVRAAVQENWGQ